MATVSLQRTLKDNKVLRLITMISSDVYPPRALHHTRPLQDVVVGLPLHLVLERTHLTLRFSICQIPCESEEDTWEKQHGCCFIKTLSKLLWLKLEGYSLFQCVWDYSKWIQISWKGKVPYQICVLWIHLYCWFEIRGGKLYQGEKWMSVKEKCPIEELNFLMYQTRNNKCYLKSLNRCLCV